MRVGAQLYSVRNKCSSAGEIKETFKKMKEYGYQSVQLSGFGFDARATKDAADEVGIHIGLTHSSADMIINHTDELIEIHRILGADTIGLGYPGGYTDGTKVDIKRLYGDFADAAKKINDAGLHFAYHNHHMELIPNEEGIIPMEWLYANTDWNFILDTGWACVAGADIDAVIAKFASRLHYVHLKDFRKKTDADASYGNCITPIGSGALPIEEIWHSLEKAGTDIAYVEQDNAVDSPDSYLEMKKSIDYLKSKGLVK